MDAEIEAVIAPVSIKIENEPDVLHLGPAAREALRIEQVAKLRARLDEVPALTDEPLDEITRYGLEELIGVLTGALRAANAVWWLIPPDVYTEDESQS